MTTTDMYQRLAGTWRDSRLPPLTPISDERMTELASQEVIDDMAESIRFADEDQTNNFDYALSDREFEVLLDRYLIDPATMYDEDGGRSEMAPTSLCVALDREFPDWETTYETGGEEDDTEYTIEFRRRQRRDFVRDIRHVAEAYNAQPEFSYVLDGLGMRWFEQQHRVTSDQDLVRVIQTFIRGYDITVEFNHLSRTRTIRFIRRDVPYAPPAPSLSEYTIPMHRWDTTVAYDLGPVNRVSAAPQSAPAAGTTEGRRVFDQIVSTRRALDQTAGTEHTLVFTRNQLAHLQQTLGSMVPQWHDESVPPIDEAMRVLGFNIVVSDFAGDSRQVTIRR